MDVEGLPWFTKVISTVVVPGGRVWKDDLRSSICGHTGLANVSDLESSTIVFRYRWGEQTYTAFS